MDRYLVVGNPIAHSKSPDIHRLFAKQTRQSLSYDARLVEEGTFGHALDAFIEEGIKGLNVTVPFKQDAYRAVSDLSDRAALAQAVNTIAMRADGSTFGENTDGLGLVHDITDNHQRRLQDQRILILGAGGAVRGILGPLLAHYPRQVVIANRTVGKAEELARAFETFGPISACGFGDIKSGPFDWIINGTAASLAGELPPLPASLIESRTQCYDMMYSAETTPFNQWARQQGAAFCTDGLGMLVEQAAESFRLWRHVRPNTAPVIDQLRASLAAT